MNEAIVADTGPLLHLSEIGQEKQLRIFELVIISDQVRLELERTGVFHSVETVLGNLLVVENVTQPELDAQDLALSSFRLHQADLSVAVLAKRIRPKLVLTDDLALRKALETYGYLVVGSIGILIRGFESGTLTKGELRKYLNDLLDGSTLYLSKGIYTYIQKLMDSLGK